MKAYALSVEDCLLILTVLFLGILALGTMVLYFFRIRDKISLLKLKSKK